MIVAADCASEMSAEIGVSATSVVASEERRDVLFLEVFQSSQHRFPAFPNLEDLFSA
jgi:hypothetical protein